MTQTRLDVKTGGSKIDVTVNTGASVGTSAVRVSFDTANVTSKEQVLNALEAVRGYLVQQKWPVQ